MSVSGDPGDTSLSAALVRDSTASLSSPLAGAIDRLDDPALRSVGVIQWAAPVLCFGDPGTALVGTLGLNPSQREFMGREGGELLGPARRLHTLESLGLASWAHADAGHLREILRACSSYFGFNPYRPWFDKLNHVVRGSGASYYPGHTSACHLDIVPYATAAKWGDLDTRQQSILTEISQDVLGEVVAESAIRLLILNGRSVVDQFQRVAQSRLEGEEITTWTLERRGGRDVKGIAYSGVVNEIGGVDLDRDVLVLGFNHNIQSSFGVTNKVVDSIREWVHRESDELEP